MPKKAYRPPPPSEPTRLRVPRAEADRKLEEQITKGEQFLAIPIGTYGQYEAVKHEFFAWNDYCRALLKSLFTNEDLFDEFATRGPFLIKANPNFGEMLHDLVEDVKRDIRTLSSIRKRLDLFDEPATPTTAPSTPGRSGRTVFVVHGRDDGLKNAVARLIERLGLKAVILHELPDGGRTLIEKFEEESVRALYVEGVELPSDLGGYIYIPVDENGAWEIRLGREMKAAGLPVDLNRLA